MPPDTTPPAEVTEPSAADLSALCQSCGACCSTSADWPRFSTEDDASLDLIPLALVDPGLGRMRCDGDRCAALSGTVGQRAHCTIYDIRPDVCRACMPGDDACRMARDAWRLPPPPLVAQDPGQSAGPPPN